MAKRRGWGEDAVYWDASKNRFVGAVSLGFTPQGQRIRKKVVGLTKQEVKDKLRQVHDDIDSGIRGSTTYTVQQAVADWLASGLDGRSEKTIRKNADVLGPVLRVIGSKRLRELTAADVQAALAHVAVTRASATVAMTHNCLTRAIRHAEARDLVRRNVSALVETPKGQLGRPSRSLSLEEAQALIVAAEDSRLCAYVVLSLTTGIRTEEARALTWGHVDLEGAPDGEPPVPPSVSVWRSVRAHGETKTEKSRRTLGMPQAAVEALEKHLVRQADDRLEAGDLWQESGLVFTTSMGTPLDAANVRREFRAVCKAARIGERWSPRELRHSFVSLMSDSGVPIEEIARLAGHSSTRTTEVVYRRELRPVLRTGAEIMDKILSKRNK